MWLSNVFEQPEGTKQSSKFDDGFNSYGGKKINIFKAEKD